MKISKEERESLKDLIQSDNIANLKLAVLIGGADVIADLFIEFIDKVDMTYITIKWMDIGSMHFKIHEEVTEYYYGISLLKDPFWSYVNIEYINLKQTLSKYLTEIINEN